MKKFWFILALMLAIPMVVPAEVIYVGQDAPTVDVAVTMAQDGDTLLLPQDASCQFVDLQGKNIEVGYDDTEPPGAVPDPKIYGPNNPFPPSPLEN